MGCGVSTVVATETQLGRNVIREASTHPDDISDDSITLQLIAFSAYGAEDSLPQFAVEWTKCDAHMKLFCSIDLSR